MRTGDRGGAQRGYGLVAVLILLALAALGLSQVSDGWVQESRRGKEQQLLRIGRLYAAAITRYRDMSPGSAKQLPKDLSELLLDRRFVGSVRHLRELYGDPVNQAEPWVVIRDEAGRIEGVRSDCDDAPMIASAIPLGKRTLRPATRYSDWYFLADPLDVPQQPSNPSRPHASN